MQQDSVERHATALQLSVVWWHCAVSVHTRKVYVQFSIFRLCALRFYFGSLQTRRRALLTLVQTVQKEKALTPRAIGKHGPGAHQARIQSRHTTGKPGSYPTGHDVFKQLK